MLLFQVAYFRGKLNMNGYIEHVHTIVDPTNLRLDLKRALPPIQTDCTHDLSGHLHMIKVRGRLKISNCCHCGLAAVSCNISH